MKNFLIGLFTFIGTTGISAQTQSITVHSQTTGKEEIIDVPESMQSEMDSLYWDWQSKNHITLGENCTMASTNPVVSDSIYMDRLSRIPSIIEMPYNEAVRKFIDMYAVRLRNKVSFMLAATNFYMPIFEEALDLYDLPQELKYLPIIESALNPVAVSRQGATGYAAREGFADVAGVGFEHVADVGASHAARQVLVFHFAVADDHDFVETGVGGGQHDVYLGFLTYGNFLRHHAQKREHETCGRRYVRKDVTSFRIGYGAPVHLFNDDGGSLQRQAVGTHYGADDLMSFGLRPGRSRHPREEYGENQPEP